MWEAMLGGGVVSTGSCDVSVMGSTALIICLSSNGTIQAESVGVIHCGLHGAECRRVSGGGRDKRYDEG